MLLIQGLLGAWLLAVYARGELHSEPLAAIVFFQSALFLPSLICFLWTFTRGTVKETAENRLLAFLGLALGAPSVWILAMWGFQSFTD